MAVQLIRSPIIVPQELEDESSNLSPRCEAFVMTGEKMLRLNSKISSSYLKAREEELPPPIITATEIAPENVKKRGPFDDFPSMQPHRTSKRTKRNEFDVVSGSHSENMLDSAHEIYENLTQNEGEYPDSTQNSCVTVNAMHTTPHNYTSTSTVQTVSSPTSPIPVDPGCGFKSEPGSPFRQINSPRRLMSHRNSPLAVRRDSFKLTISVGLKEGETHSTTGDSGVVGMHDNYNDSLTENPPDSPSSVASNTPLKEKLRQLDSNSKCVPALTNTDQCNASRLAHRLFSLDGFKMCHVAPILYRNTDYYNLVAEEYANLFSFHNQTLDHALRCFLAKFNLTGETHERDRILVHFSNRYLKCNPTLFPSTEEVHVLVAAILLLNTDLHGPNLGKRMSSREFINNISNTDFSYNKDMLKNLYQAIKLNPIQWARDDSSSCGGSQITLPYQCDLSSRLTQVDPETQVDHKKGWVMRKCVIDEDGKRTPFGRRGWKIFYATLKGMVLYLHTKENGFKHSSYNTFKNAIRLHHAFALEAPYYNKKQNVFRLRSATLGEYLFQASSPDDMNDWMDKINFIAACFSRPPLPAPVSCDDTFHRPLLPSAPSTLSMSEQLQEHEHQLGMVEDRRERLVAPPLHTTGRQRDQYFVKERYLGEELQRYSTYIALLRKQLYGGMEHPDSLCSSSTNTPVLADNLSYKEAILSRVSSQDIDLS